MALTITETEITSDEIGAYARWSQHAAADGSGAWVVYGDGRWDGRLFDRNQAISAMTLEEEKASPAPDQALIASLESELPASPGHGRRPGQSGRAGGRPTPTPPASR
jgi:hypothetical protein